MRCVWIFFCAFFIMTGLVFNVDAGGSVPKYIFLFIGDGMAMPQVNAAEAYTCIMGNKPYKPGVLAMTRMPVSGHATTYALDRYITGSAAAGTALATGNKTTIGTISMSADGKTKYPTIAEMAKRRNMKTGIISSVDIDHATPACFYAHEPQRSHYYEIACQLAQSEIDFIGGGGVRDSAGLHRVSARDSGGNVYERARQNGFTVIRSRAEFEKCTAGDGKIWAVNPVLDKDGAMPYAIDSIPGSIALHEYTQKAISLLDNEHGFFIMVEAGKIDWACHANDAATAIHETLAFDKAIQRAVEFYEAHPDETLILVTGDHECGGLGLGFAGTRYETGFPLLSHQRISFTRLTDSLRTLKARIPADKVSLASLRDLLSSLIGIGEAIELTDAERMRLLKALNASWKGEEIESKDPGTYLLYGGYDPFVVTLTHILNNKAGLAWTSYKHTALPVPVFALGIGAHQFGGYYDNTDIAKRIMNIAGWSE